MRRLFARTTTPPRIAGRCRLRPRMEPPVRTRRRDRSDRRPAGALLGLACPEALGCCASTSQPGSDPLEPINRPIFSVNLHIDDSALGPVARDWRMITPQAARDSISNAYHNLTFPDCFVSSLGEGALRKPGAELARFLINSTMGIGGFLDPATVAGIPKYDEDVAARCWPAGASRRIRHTRNGRRARRSRTRSMRSFESPVACQPDRTFG